MFKKGDIAVCGEPGEQEYYYIKVLKDETDEDQITAEVILVHTTTDDEVQVGVVYEDFDPDYFTKTEDPRTVHFDSLLKNITKLERLCSKKMTL